MTNVFSELGINQTNMSFLTNINYQRLIQFVSSNDYDSIPSKSKKVKKYPIKAARDILSHLFRSNFEINSKIISFYNFKGGTGKTSICYQVSSHLAIMGFKVLVIDADPQAHLSTSFGVSSEEKNPTLYDVLANGVPIDTAVIPVYDGLDLIPSNLSLTRVEVDLNAMPKREERLKIALDKYYNNYDYILIDTNPNISTLNRNVMTCSEQINLVCETQPYSLNGLSILLDDMHSFFEKMEMEEPLINIIPNKYEDRVSSSAEVMTLLRDYYSEYLIHDFAVRRSEDINTSAKRSLPLIFFAKKNSIAMEDIKDLIHILIDQTTTKVVKKKADAA